MKDNERLKAEILNNLGQMIKEEEITFKNNNATIKTVALPNGVYFLKLTGDKPGTVSKRFVISR